MMTPRQRRLKERQERLSLRREIEAIDDLQNCDDLLDLRSRVELAHDSTVSQIGKFQTLYPNGTTDPGEADWWRRAVHASRFYERALDRLDTALKRLRHAELIANQVSSAVTRQQEKTKRHEISQMRQMRIKSKIIQLLISEGIVSEEEMWALTRKAEAIVDGVPVEVLTSGRQDEKDRAA